MRSSLLFRAQPFENRSDLPVLCICHLSMLFSQLCLKCLDATCILHDKRSTNQWLCAPKSSVAAKPHITRQHCSLCHFLGQRGGLHLAPTGSLSQCDIVSAFSGEPHCLFHTADLGTVVAPISCVCIKHPLGSISLCAAPTVWGDAFIRAHVQVHQGHDPHCFVIPSSPKTGTKICQDLEKVLCTGRAARVIIPVPKLVHTRRKASPRRGNGHMDNHLLKRKTLRLLGAVAIL